MLILAPFHLFFTPDQHQHGSKKKIPSVIYSKGFFRFIIYVPK